MADPKQAEFQPKAKSVTEKSLPAPVSTFATPAQGAGEMVVDSLAEPLRGLVKEKVAAGLPLRSAIECSRAQIAHDAALAAAAQETTAKAK